MKVVKTLIALALSLSMMAVVVGCAPAGNQGTTPSNTSPGNTNKSTPSQTTTGDWRKFLNDYDAWATEYVKLMERYKANPNDANLAADYNKLAGEITKWAEGAATATQGITEADQAEFDRRIQEITNKLTTASTSVVPQ